MLRSANRSTIIASALGMAALLLEAASLSLPISPGAFFLFLSAMAFGLEGAMFSCLIGVLPILLLNNADYFYVGRLLTLTSAVALWQHFGFRRPGVIAVALGWLGLIALGLLASAISPTLHGILMEPETPAISAALMLSDLLTVTGVCIFLSTDIGWYSLVQRSRIPSFTNYLILFVTSSSLITLALCVITGWESAKTPMGAVVVMTLSAAAALVPPVMFLASKKLLALFREDHKDSQLSLNADRDRGFSGHSAMFWRRKQLANTLDHIGSDSAMEIRAPKDGFGPEYGVCVLDGTGAVTLANRKFIKLVGAAEREPCGKPFAHWGMTPEISRTFIDLAMAPSPLKRTREVRLARGENSADRFFELSVIPSALAPGSLHGGPGTNVLTIREVTDTRAIEMRLLQSQKLASLGSVVTSIGHAFNSALTTIIGRASHARLVTDRAVMVEGLDAIIAEAQRAGTFVNKLQDFANDSPRAKAIFDAREFVTERKELFMNVLGTEHHLDIVLPERSLGVSCDPNLLTQAIANLLLNARESLGNNGGRVTISLGLETIDPDVALLNVSAYPGTFVRVRIADTGHGMSPEVLQHACEPTFTTRSAAGHSGLGLPTAFAVARAHDGFLTIESTPNRGTTISVYLPEVQLANTTVAATSDAATTPEPKPVAAAEPPRVLVLDDEPTVRELVAGMLQALGAEVVSCDKPQDALDIAKDKPFDVAFVDLVMPSMGGNEFVDHLRAQPKGANTSLPVVLMTGHGAVGDHNKSIHSVLPKPFTMDDLKSVLKATARQR